MQQKKTTKEEYQKCVNVVVEYIIQHLGEDIDLVRFHVYLRREEIGEKEELFQIRYQDGDIILDGINGKR